MNVQEQNSSDELEEDTIANNASQQATPLPDILTPAKKEPKKSNDDNILVKDQKLTQNNIFANLIKISGLAKKDATNTVEIND